MYCLYLSTVLNNFIVHCILIISIFFYSPLNLVCDVFIYLLFHFFFFQFRQIASSFLFIYFLCLLLTGYFHVFYFFKSVVFFLHVFIFPFSLVRPRFSNACALTSLSRVPACCLAIVKVEDSGQVRTRPRPNQLSLSPNSNARPAKMRHSQIPDDYLDQGNNKEGFFFFFFCRIKRVH